MPQSKTAASDLQLTVLVWCVRRATNEEIS